MMPKRRNCQSGVVVSCSDATAARLGNEWKPVEPPRKRAPKKTDSEE